MAGSLIAGAFLFTGYTLVWYGWMRLGGPVNLLDLLVPGRPEPARGGGPAVWDTTSGIEGAGAATANALGAN